MKPILDRTLDDDVTDPSRKQHRPPNAVSIRQATPQAVHAILREALHTLRVVDMHTHIYGPEFGDRCLWGIDELLTYHYLLAEFFRVHPMEPRAFYALVKQQQADLIWQHLFVDRAPISDAARGVVTVLSEFGLDTSARNLTEAREFFRGRAIDSHFDDVLNRAGVGELVMTNDPFDAGEVAAFPITGRLHPRIRTSLRLDALFARPREAFASMAHQGFDGAQSLPGGMPVIRRFLDAWIRRAAPMYLGVSFGPEFAYPDQSVRTSLLREVVVPACLEHGLPLSLMIGVRRAVNSELRLAGDGAGVADVSAIENICLEFPRLRVLTTFLARENQHALCVAARKFRNLTPFGCWWFMNTASLVTETTRMRMELLGATFIAQHSDARVLEQLIYKWHETRRLLAVALAPSYTALAESGWPLSAQQIERDMRALLADNFTSLGHEKTTSETLSHPASG